MWNPTDHIASTLASAPLGWLLRAALSYGWKFVVRRSRDSFLEYDPRVLDRLYRDERRLAGFLPYREEVNWVDELLQRREPEIRLKTISKSFELDPGNLIWREVRDEAAEAFRIAGHAKTDSQVVRLEAIEQDEMGTRLTIQRARYRDQVRSNLILDYKGREPYTLRTLLAAETPNRLPQLEDRRLANTIGMATLLLYPDKDGVYVPYFLQRQKHLAVFRGGIHASSSCAAEWRLDSCEDFGGIFIDDMYGEIDDEIGVKRSELSSLYPIALCREFLRGGKPQLFFLATTGLRRNELAKRRAEAIERNKKFNAQKVEVLPDRAWRRSDFVDSIRSYARLRHKMTLEGAALLFYLAELISKLRAVPGGQP